MTRYCKESIRCSKCSRKHYFLLHDDNYKPKQDEKSQSQTTTTTNLCTLQNPTVFLRTLPVRICKNGQEVVGVALLDCGAQPSLATDELFEKLQVRSKRRNLRIKTITGQQTNYESMTSDLTIKSLDGEGMIAIENVRSISNLPIAKECSAAKDDVTRFDHLKDVPLNSMSESVFLLIGSDAPDAFYELDEGRRKQKELCNHQNCTWLDYSRTKW